MNASLKNEEENDMAEPLLSHKPEIKRFQSFIIFEPASIRVAPTDIFLQGKAVKDFYDELIEKVVSEEQTIQVQILQNRLAKIGQMLELLNEYENVVISKYFDRIWRRYSYISHLGENILDLPTLLKYFPDYNVKEADIIAQRFDDDDDDFDPDSDDDDDNDDETSDDSNEASEDEQDASDEQDEE